MQLLDPMSIISNMGLFQYLSVVVYEGKWGHTEDTQMVHKDDRKHKNVHYDFGEIQRLLGHWL